MLVKIIILILVLLVIGGGSVFLIKSQSTANSNQENPISNQKSRNYVYQNSTFGYVLTLPDNWSVCESESAEPTVRIGKNQKCNITWDESFLLTPTVGADYIADRRQNEPFLFYVKRIEDSDKSILKDSGKVDYKLTQLDGKNILVESSYVPFDESINPTFMVSIYHEMSPLETLILNSEEETNPVSINKENLILAASKIQNYEITTGDLIGVVSKNDNDGKKYYPNYQFQIVETANNQVIPVKSSPDGTFLVHLKPGEYLLKTGTKEQSFNIEKGRILRLNFGVN